jgi:hypothetical protein
MSASVRRCASPAPAAADQGFILQRSGARPIRFDGSLLACSDDEGAPEWARLRLALYRRQDGGYVCEMVRVPAQRWSGNGGARPSLCHAAMAGTLEAAVLEFETMVVEADDSVPIRAPADAAAALFDAAGRLWRETACERALRHEVGRFLYRVCIELAGR